MQALTTKYNVLYNAEQSYHEGMQIINKAHTDDYSKILPLYPISVHSNAFAAIPQMDRTIEKTQKAIKNHSIKKKPTKDPKQAKDAKYQAFLKQEEYNYMIDEAWMLSGKAQFHKAEFLAAVGTFTYIINHFSHNNSCVSEARIWLARSYIEMGWLYEAEDILIKANKDQIPQKLSGIYSAVSTHLLLKEYKYKEAIPLLTIAAQEESDKMQQTRFYYILAQLHRLVNDNVLAKLYFTKVIKANPPIEMEFNARISKAEVQTKEPGEAIAGLQKMLKNSKYKTYEDKLYFTMGNIYQKQKEYDKAIVNYTLAIEKSNNNIVNKVQILLALADLHYSQQAYLKAQPYYNDAVIIMPIDNVDYEKIRARSQLLDKLNQQNEIVQLQDSLQQLSALSDAEKIMAVEVLIKSLQAEELALKEKLMADAKVQNEAFYAQQSAMPEIGPSFNERGSSDWYFYNKSLIFSGLNDFRQKWGSRKLEDNWRRKNKAILSNDDFSVQYNESSKQTDATIGVEQGGIVDRSLVNSDVNYYLNQIPVNKAQIESSNQQIADALYTIGMIFIENIQDIENAIRTFEELERRFPSYSRLPDIYYNLYQMSMKANDTVSATRYRNQLRAKFPNSSYGKMFSMPDYAERIALLKMKEDSIYQETYFAYLDDDFEAVFDNCVIIKEEYPLTELMPKFLFVKALSYGKSQQNDLFVETLQQVINDYPQSDVSAMAKDILALTKQGMVPQAGGSHGSILSRRDSMCLCQDVVVDTVSFTHDPKVKHLILIVSAPEISLSKLQYVVAMYNFTGFMIKDFDIEIQKRLTNNYLLISPLDGYNEAVSYKNGLFADALVKSFIDSNNCFSVIISESNFNLIRKGSSLDSYIQFFTATISKSEVEGLFLNENSVKGIDTIPYVEMINEPSVELAVDSFSVNTPIVEVPLNKTASVISEPEKPIAIVVTEVSAVIEKKPAPASEVKALPKTEKVQVKNEMAVEAKEKLSVKEEAKLLPAKIDKPKNEEDKSKKNIIIIQKSDSIKTKSTDYIYNAKDRHIYGIVVLDGSFDYDALKNKIDGYNAEKYSLANYKVSMVDIGGAKLLLVESFPNLINAKTYLFNIIRNRDLFEVLKQAEYRNLIISKSNLSKLIDAKNISDYLEFNRNINMR